MNTRSRWRQCTALSEPIIRFAKLTTPRNQEMVIAEVEGLQEAEKLIEKYVE